MKKNVKTTNTPQRARTAVLTEQALTAVVGGTGGTIIVENLLPDLQGVGGSGLQGVGGSGLQGVGGSGLQGVGGTSWPRW